MGGPQKGLEDKPCDICGSLFTPYRSTSRLCSGPCRSKASQERIKKFHAANPGSSMLYRSRSSPEAKEKIKQAQRRYYIDKRYELTVEEYDYYMDLYGRKCALCGSTDRPNLDHDHVTGRIRGVLCTQHNTAIGNLGDSEEAVWAALAYLISFTDRPGWDTFFLWIARAVSLRGDCIRRQVGSVLVDENHIIRGAGFNGSEPGGKSCKKGECPRCLSNAPSGSSYGGCLELHSEDNCLRNSNTTDAKYLTMYITCAPCSNCKDLLFDFGVDKVVWPEGHLDLIPKL